MVRSRTPVGDGGGSGVGGSAGFHVPLLRGGVAFGLANLRSKLRCVFCSITEIENVANLIRQVGQVLEKKQLAPRRIMFTRKGSSRRELLNLFITLASTCFRTQIVAVLQTTSRS